jgi:toxin HigB-1
MIRSFRDRRTAAIAAGKPLRGVDRELAKRAREKLRLLDDTADVDDLRATPGNKLERLGGDRAGQWSIRVNLQWRICFRWEEDGAWDVEFVDYHRG